MWLNAVAHGELGRVRDLAGLVPFEREAALTWPNARAYVAREVLARSREDVPELRRLQWCVLVPMELRLIGQSGLTPHRLARLTVTELRLDR